MSYSKFTSILLICIICSATLSTRNVIAFSSSRSIHSKTTRTLHAALNRNNVNPSSATIATTQYPQDENQRPADLKNRRLPIHSLQTPHSGRKFRPTHPYYYKKSFRILQHPTITTLFDKLYRNRRFTEGWYYRLTLPQYKESFVFIFSIEDAGRYVKQSLHNNNVASGKQEDDDARGKQQPRILPNWLFSKKRLKSPFTLACMQLLGPGDTYLCQGDVDDTKFWGWRYSQGLGCVFEWLSDEDDDDVDSSNAESTTTAAALMPEEWRSKVKSGFQILPFHFQGRLNGHDGSLGGVKDGQGVPGTAEYDFTIDPVAGWGNYPPMISSGTNDTVASSVDYRQYSTAGWLANYPVFEPHWQITMANARASGTLNWNGTKYEFHDAPFYAEKNWGGAFPTKWYWAQCNSFDNHPDLAFTAGGGIRQLPFSFLPGKKTETLGLIGIHHNGTFYEIVPWTGEMDWKVWPWGRWEFRGRCTNRSGRQFEAEVVAYTDDNVPGVLLRAPTKDEGMQYFCRDSGFGRVTLSLWHLEWNEELNDYVRAHGKEPIVDRAQSNQCAVEVGGGPWWDVWTVSSKMSRPLKWMVRLPYRIRNVFR